MILKGIYDAIPSRCEAAFGLLASRRLWLAWGVALAIALSLFMSFPRVSFFLGNDGQIVNFWPMLERQAADPLAMSGDQYKDQSSHDSKLTFRLTLPMTMKVLYVDWRAMLVIQYGLGVLLLALVGKIAMDSSRTASSRWPAYSAWLRSMPARLPSCSSAAWATPLPTPSSPWRWHSAIHRSS